MVVTANVVVQDVALTTRQEEYEKQKQQWLAEAAARRERRRKAEALEMERLIDADDRWIALERRRLENDEWITEERRREELQILADVKWITQEHGRFGDARRIVEDLRDLECASQGGWDLDMKELTAEEQIVLVSRMNDGKHPFAKLTTGTYGSIRAETLTLRWDQIAWREARFLKRKFLGENRDTVQRSMCMGTEVLTRLTAV